MDLSEINKIMNKTDSGVGHGSGKIQMPRKRVDKSRSSVSMREKGAEYAVNGICGLVYTKYTKNTKNTKYSTLSSTPMSSSRADQKQELKEKNHIEETVNVIEKESVSEPLQKSQKDLGEDLSKASIQMRYTKNLDKNGKPKGKPKRKVNIQLTLNGRWFSFRCDLTTEMSKFRQSTVGVISNKDQQEVINDVTALRSSIIGNGLLQKGHKVYIGKIRSLSKFVKGVVQKQKIIPLTYTVVYYNSKLHAWEFIIRFKSWHYSGEFSAHNLTESQKEADFVGQHFYYKQEYVTYKTDADKLEDMGY